MAYASQQAFIRFGLGSRPGDSPLSDPPGALMAQLDGPDPALASGAFAGLPTGLDAMDALRADRLARRQLLLAGEKPDGKFKPKTRALYMRDAGAQLNWAVTTDAAFRERLVWFWANHFSVSINQGETAGLVGPLVREAIRPHVTGNFTAMVLAVERHPAMLRYLANDVSIGPESPAGRRTGRGLNENLGRECMELHTVGLAAGYSQADVTSMAKILTGWSVAGSQQGGDVTGFRYRPMTHEPGPQTVMGHSFDGGEAAGIAALTFLSRHPTTYRMLARQLATHFVADQPPEAAVNRLANALANSGGELMPAYAALVRSPEAWEPLGKLKTPQEYMVSVLRAAPIPDRPGNLRGNPPGNPPLNLPGVLNRLGQPLWGAPLPDGWPDQAAAWAGSDAVMSRIDWAYTYAGRLDGSAARPEEVASAALGPLLRPATLGAVQRAGSQREALALLFASPEFQRR